MTEKPIVGDLPEGVASAMFLRDGWPDAVVCKVLMKNGCVGIGLVRRGKEGWGSTTGRGYDLAPSAADQEALENALKHVSAAPPDYSEVLEHMARMQAAAELLAAETSGSA